jgi:hypothetical protein
MTPTSYATPTLPAEEPPCYVIVRTGHLVHHEGWSTAGKADRAYDIAPPGAQVLIYTREAWEEERGRSN